MITKINSIEDIKLFAKQIKDESSSFHPYDDFKNYVNLKTNEPSYTKEQAEIRNNLMSECLNFCDKEGLDIYEIMLDVTLVETGLDKHIPLPSSLK